MLTRYEAVLDNQAQGLITLIPFLEDVIDDNDTLLAINKIDIFIESNLPYPVKDGRDVYAGSGGTLVAYFTDEGTEFFGEKMDKLAEIAQCYLEEFGYEVRIIEIEDIEEPVYEDWCQVIVDGRD